MMKVLTTAILKDDPSRALIDSSADLRYQIKNANYERKVASINVNGDIKTKTVVLAREIAQLAEGKKEGSLIDALRRRRDIATFRISFFPPWLFSVPKNTNHVRVVIENTPVQSISSK